MIEKPRLEELVGSSVRMHPNLPAVELAGISISYQDLWDAAGGVAKALRSSWPRNGRFGLHDRRSIGTYVAYLGILRAGGTVVPLSRLLPNPRLFLICKDAGLNVTISSAASGPDLVAPDVEWLTPEPASEEWTQQDTAYILFTSGSTGRPKGVPISHANACSYVRCACSLFDYRPGSRASQLFDLGFDVSIHDLFVTWTSGATLVIPDSASGRRPVKWAREQAITHWASVPSAIAAADILGDLREPLRELQSSIFIGEPLYYDSCNSWQRVAPRSRIVNLYGPTELTVAVSSYEIPRDPDRRIATPNGTVPIGKVFPHMEYRIFGSDVGGGRASGELVARGPQRFDGYLSSAADGDRFLVEDETFGAASWYRSGDVVTEIEANLVHLGRVDNQVKVRGHRVELGEVESCLRRLNGTIDAAVVAYRRADVDVTELAAFVASTSLSSTAIRKQLRATVPGYMVPRDIHVVDDVLPATSSGKVDRASLSELAAAVHRRIKK